MKYLIIYYSNHNNNTEKLAEVFAKTIPCELIKINKENMLPIDLGDYDLIGFGSGVYQENLSEKMFKLVDGLDLKGKNVFVFSTSGVGMKFYNKALINKLETKGAIIRGSFACKGAYRSEDFTDIKVFHLMSKLADGHPNDKDLLMAGRFIIDLVNSFEK